MRCDWTQPSPFTAAERISAHNEENPMADRKDPNPPADLFATNAATIAQWARMNPDQFHEHVLEQPVTETFGLIQKAEELSDELSTRTAEALSVANRMRDVLRESASFSVLAQTAEVRAR